MDQIERRDESAELPYWMLLGDNPWYAELSDPPQEFILVGGREVSVARSFAQGIHIVDMEYWPRWVHAIGILAIPFISFGILQTLRLSLQIHEVDLLPTSCPIFIVRLKGMIILRTTNFELAREVIRHQIMKR